MEFLGRAGRFPLQLLGDFRAQVSAVRTGERRVRELLGRIGFDTFCAVKANIFAHAAYMDRAAVRDLPDGTYSAEGVMDNDGVTDDPYRVALSVTINDDKMIVDLHGSAGPVQGPVNCGFAQTVSAIRLAYKAVINTSVPVTGGTFAPLDIIVPEECIFNAREPAACEWYFSALGLLVDLFVKALQHAVGERATAAHYGDSMVVGFTGVGEPDGRRVWAAFGPTVGGWGAYAGGDGATALINLTNGAFRNMPVEVYESRYPVVIEEFGIRTDSGGVGRWRGGCGVVRVFRLMTDASVSLWMERSVTTAWGLQGGMAGEGPQCRDLWMRRRRDAIEAKPQVVRSRDHRPCNDWRWRGLWRRFRPSRGGCGPGCQ